MDEPEPGRTRGEVVEIHPRPETDALRGEEPPAAAEKPPAAADERALRDEIDHLQAAAEKASGHVRNLYLFFLSFGLYLAIIFGATTHEQLLRAAPVTLPLFNVDLPLLGFFWVAPALFVLLHFNLLLQCRLLAGKVQRLDAAIGRLGDPGRQAVARARLDVFPLTQLLLRRHHGRPMRLLLWLIVVLTVLTLPVVLLLAGQVSFLPYHDAATTMWHRVLVTLDVLLLLIFWRRIRHPEDHLLVRPGRWLWHQSKALPGTLTALALSWLILTFPGDDSPDWGDPMEEFALAIAPASFTDHLTGQPTLWPTRYVFERLSFLDRNLIVRELILVSNWPNQAQVQQYGEEDAWHNFGGPISLRDRDLRYAILDWSNLTRADLRGADLSGASLYGTKLVRASISCFEEIDSSRRCARLRGVYARRADLQGADLQSANLQGADLIHAELQGVDVRWANLQGAVLVYTSLQGANLDVADLRGADLRSANLQGAGLGSADLQGADLDYADLQGAFLGYTKLQGVNLRDANLQGANLRSADLQGAVLLGANLRGADLRSAYLWRALLEEDEDLNDRWVLADLRWVGLEPMERAERLGGAMVPMRDAEAFVDRMLRQIEHEGTREFVRAKLRFHLIDDAAWREVVRAYLYSTYDAAWEDVPNFFPAWRSEPNVMFDPGDPLPRQLGWGLPKWPTEHTYDEDLASFLGELACEYASVHVAQGLARRATEVRDRDRLYAKLLAERLLGDDCAPTAGLPDDVRDDLRRLAGP